jgi:hypothetical protein
MAFKGKKRRQQSETQSARRRDLSPELQQCPVCGTPMEERSRSERSGETLQGFFSMVSHAVHWPVPSCAFAPGHRRPEAEDLVALQGSLFGVAVVARMGEWRFAHTLTIPTMPQRVRDEPHRSISQRAVGLLADVSVALVATVAKHDPALRDHLSHHPGGASGAGWESAREGPRDAGADP